MNKTVIIAGSLGALLVVGIVAYFLIPKDSAEDEYSSFGFTNDVTERPADATDEFPYEDDAFSEYGSEVPEVSYQGDTGGADGDGSLYRESVAGQFPGITPPAPGGESASQSRSTSGGSSGGSSGGGGGSISRVTTSNPVDSSPSTFALSVTSPTAGDTFENSDGCPDEVDEENQDTVCLPSPVAQVFWDYDDPSAKITLELYNESGTRVRTFATKTGNSGRYTWEYSPTIPNGDYKIVAKAYSPDGTLRATDESGMFELAESDDPIIGTPVVSSASCPPVPSKVRTYTPADFGSDEDFYCSAENGGCLSSVQLRHYRYPETLSVGKALSLVERCGLTTTPGSRTCPYPTSIYANTVERNTYSIMTREPDPTNDPNEEGDRRLSAYLKPIIGISNANRAFDMSIPFTISTAEVGKAYDFQWTPENQSLTFTGQYSISECEGDYSERAVWTSLPGDVWVARAAILSTNGLEGMVKKVSGSIGGTPILALKAGKTYYFNLRWVYSVSGGGCLNNGSGGCLSPFVRTDQIPDSMIHAHALRRQLARDPGAHSIEFYRFKFLQYPYTNFPTATQLEADPFFRKPGEAFIDYALYNPACGETPGRVLQRSLIAGVNDRLLNLDNTLLDSQCRPVCAAPGYVAEGNKCVRE